MRGTVWIVQRTGKLLEQPGTVVCASLIVVLSGSVSWADNSNVSSIPQITSVRAFNVGRGLRILIELDDDVRIRQGCLSKPDRLYFDFRNVRLGPAIQPTHIARPRQVRGIRFGVHQPQSVRMVLDLNRVSGFVAFKVVAPSRLIVDLKAGSASGSTFCRRAMQGKRVREADVGRIVIDPGHGGDDPGSVGPKATTESAVTLGVSEQLARLLEEKLGLDVVLTRRTDTDVSLSERAEMTNRASPDIFLSLHADTRPAWQRCGPHTYYLNLSNSSSVLRIATRENAAFNRTIFELPDLITSILEDGHMKESRALARSIARATSTLSTPKRLRRGSEVPAGGPFAVLLGINTAGVVVSLGCITNSAEERLLNTASHQGALSQAIYVGIRNFLRSRKNARARGGRKSWTQVEKIQRR